MTLSRETVSLNGKWDIVFDPKNTGKDKNWAKKLPAKREKLQVPGIWELIKPEYDGVAWYSRNFKVTAEQLAKVVRIKFGAVHYFSETYINGQLAGTHEGGGSQFEFDITKLCTEGENIVTLRVIGPPMNEEVEGFRSGAPLNQGETPVGKAGWYFNYGGIWQDVELEITDKVYIDNIYVKPFIKKAQAEVQVTLCNKGAAAKTDLAIAIAESKSGKSVIEMTKSVKLKKGENTVIFKANFPNKKFKFWSCEDPFMYTAAATIGDDSSCVRFGMREFNLAGGHFTLNGERITLKGYLQQGIYPKTIIFPETREMGYRELKLLKDNGYNFIRAHLKAANPWWLDMCDELGILIEGEPGIGWIGKHPDTERRCKTEIDAMLIRDRNHPSIIFWCLLNEAYHFRGFSMNEIKKMTDRLAKGGRKLDDTRLLMDTSGGGGGAAAAGGALVWLPNVAKQGVMTDDHAYCSMPLSDSSIENYRTMGKKGLPLFISEFGAPLAPPNYAKVMKKYTAAERKLGLEDYVLHKSFYDSLSDGFKKAGLKKAFGTVEKFIDKIDQTRSDEMELVTRAQRCNPTLVGTAFCQLADASGEEFGATDFFRQPKKVFKGLTAAVQVPLISPEIYPRVQQPSAKSKVHVTLINEDKLGANYDYSIEIVSKSGKTIEKIDSGKVKASKYIQTVFSKKIAADLKAGVYKLRAEIKAKGKVVNTSDIEFTVVSPAKSSIDQVCLWDKTGVMDKFFKNLGVERFVFSNNSREKDMPVILDCRDVQSKIGRHMLLENYTQLKKIAQTGGVGILINPEPVVLQDFLFDYKLRPARTMRALGYVKSHEIFKGLPADCVANYVYAGIFPNDYELGEDVLAAGGEVICGGLSGHMWTRPADYVWGGGVYTVPVGRGKIIVSQMNILNDLDNNVIAQRLLANMANYAQSMIKPGLNHLLLSRCIDPLKPSDYA